MQKVDYPPVVKAEDLGVRSAKWAAALDQANARIDAGNACDGLKSEIYAGKVPARLE